jgi:IS1 family transposase
MVQITLKCPYCGSENVFTHGKDRYRCENPGCSHKTFKTDYKYNACAPETKSKIYFATVNGNGTRATARMLNIGKNTVTNALKSIEPLIWHINYNYIEARIDSEIDVEFVRIDEAEMDEMWSFYGDKKHQIWLWWAIDHASGEPLAFCFGSREHKYAEELKSLLEQFFTINIVYSDDNFAYQKTMTDSVVIVGKENTQTIERKHLSLRTWCSRLVRKGIRFSKNFNMHIIVVGLVINFWFFNNRPWI